MSGSRLLICVLVGLCCGCPGGDSPPAPQQSQPSATPSPTGFETRWPDEEDLRLLKSVEGKTPSEVLRILGRPMRVEPHGEGGERWFYPWTAACTVTFAKGVVVSTYYTGGY